MPKQEFKNYIDNAISILLATIEKLDEETRRKEKEYIRQYAHSHDSDYDITLGTVLALGEQYRPDISFWKELSLAAQAVKAEDYYEEFDVYLREANDQN